MSKFSFHVSPDILILILAGILRFHIGWQMDGVVGLVGVVRSQEVGEDHSPQCIVKRIRALLEAGNGKKRYETMTGLQSGSPAITERDYGDLQQYYVITGSSRTNASTLIFLEPINIHNDNLCSLILNPGGPPKNKHLEEFPVLGDI